MPDSSFSSTPASPQAIPAVQPAQVLLPLGLGTALSLMGDATLYTVLPTHTAEAGVMLAGVGVLLSVNRLIRLLTNGLAGGLYDRANRRGLFVGALFLGALSTLVYALSRSFWPLFAGRLLWGIAWSGIWVGGTTIILDVTGDGDRGRWTGLYQTWFFLGAALGSLSGGVLTDLIGYRLTLWVGAGLTALGGAYAWLRLPETRPRGIEPNLPRPSWLAMLAGSELPGRVWAAVLVQGINRFVGAGVLAATLALVVEQGAASLGLAWGVASLTGFLVAGRTFLSLVAAPVAGNLSDRGLGRWRVMVFGALLGALGMALVARGGLPAILGGILLVAVAGGSLQALVTAATGDLVRLAQRGRAIGLLHTIGDLGSAIGPPLAYGLLPWIGLGGIYWLCAGLYLLAGGIAWLALFSNR